MSIFDRVLTVLENPVRRKIIQRLSQGVSYPLELSGDIGVHQQLVAKHLKVMEEADVVEASRESSPCGPDRRMYGLTKSMSVTIDFAPDLYAARMFSFEDISISKQEMAGELRDRLHQLSTRDRPLEGINPFAELIADIDNRITELESERTVLLHLRSLAMHAAKEIIQGKSVSLSERRVLHHILNDHVRNAREISNNLDIREEVVKIIINRLREQSILR